MVFSLWTVILRKTTIVKTFVPATNRQPANNRVVDKQQLVDNSFSTTRMQALRTGWRFSAAEIRLRHRMWQLVMKNLNSRALTTVGTGAVDSYTSQSCYWHVMITRWALCRISAICQLSILNWVSNENLPLHFRNKLKHTTLSWIILFNSHCKPAMDTCTSLKLPLPKHYGIYLIARYA